VRDDTNGIFFRVLRFLAGTKNAFPNQRSWASAGLYIVLFTPGYALPRASACLPGAIMCRAFSAHFWISLGENSLRGAEKP
jgi:hypothetical protein